MGFGMSMGGSGGGGRPDDGFYQNRLKSLMTNPNAFQQTPGFKAALDTGRQAIERSFAARGMGNSGNVLAELMKYGTGLSSQEYGSQMDRLSGLAGREDSMNFNRAESDKASLGKWLDYGLNKDRLALDTANSQNQFNLGTFNANTSRGSARSGDWWRQYGGL